MSTTKRFGDFVANELFVKKDPAEKLSESDSDGKDNDDVRGDEDRHRSNEQITREIPKKAQSRCLDQTIDQSVTRRRMTIDEDSTEISKPTRMIFLLRQLAVINNPQEEEERQGCARAEKEREASRIRQILLRRARERKKDFHWLLVDPYRRNAGTVRVRLERRRTETM